jgi:hypothetical protein
VLATNKRDKGTSVFEGQHLDVVSHFAAVCLRLFSA